LSSDSTLTMSTIVNHSIYAIISHAHSFFLNQCKLARY